MSTFAKTKAEPEYVKALTHVKYNNPALVKMLTQTLDEYKARLVTVPMDEQFRLLQGKAQAIEDLLVAIETSDK